MMHDTRDGVALARPFNEEWLAFVAHGAAAEASLPAELLGGYLTMLADAAVNGRRPQRSELDDVRMLGRQAAEEGIGARQVVDLFLSAAGACGPNFRARCGYVTATPCRRPPRPSCGWLAMRSPFLWRATRPNVGT